jgi:hypothetical protein
VRLISLGVEEELLRGRERAVRIYTARATHLAHAALIPALALGEALDGRGAGGAAAAAGRCAQTCRRIREARGIRPPASVEKTHER